MPFLYSCAAVDKTSTYKARRAVPLRQMLKGATQFDLAVHPPVS